MQGILMDESWLMWEIQLSNGMGRIKMGQAGKGVKDKIPI